MPAPLDSYLDILKGLPFVTAVAIEREPARFEDTELDATLSVRTPTGKERLYFEVKTSNLSTALATQVVGLAGRVRPLLVAAPVIGAGIGDFLAAHDTNFVDLRGNCYLKLDEGRYVARIQGKTGMPRAEGRALRTAGYQVIFTLLANPSLVGAPVRELASAAGVSRQPALSVRQRLADLGHVARKGRGFAWLPSGQRRTMDLWLASYAAAVRPRLLVGRYRTADDDPDALEARVRPLLDEACAWKWGGGAAALRLTGHYRGEQTVVHVADEPADLAKRLRAVPDAAGPLVLLRAPGPAGMLGATADTAHPLLVYSELLADGSERAREAAEQVATKYTLGKGP